jgi:hypothetical protein
VPFLHCARPGDVCDARSERSEDGCTRNATMEYGNRDLHEQLFLRMGKIGSQEIRLRTLRRSWLLPKLENTPTTSSVGNGDAESRKCLPDRSQKETLGTDTIGPT